MLKHQTAILRLRRLIRVTARVQGDRRAADAEFLSAKNVVVFSVVTFVAQDATRTPIRGGLTHRFGKLRRILARTAIRRDPNDQMRRRVEYGGQLRPCRMSTGLETARTALKMNRSVTRFKSGRVDRGRSIRRMEA